MPDCAERTLGLLVDVLSSGDVPRESLEKEFSCDDAKCSRPGKIAANKHIVAALFADLEHNENMTRNTNLEQRMFLRWREQFKNEGLISRSTNFLIDSVQKDIEYGSEESLKRACGSLITILKEIRPFHIDLCLELAEKSTQKFKGVLGEDLVLILGGTGAGKSTLVHLLGGSEFNEILTADGLPHLKIVQFGCEELKVVSTSPHAKSDTMDLHLLKIHVDGFTSKGKTFFYVCDTPGFNNVGCEFDLELDVANGYSIVNAAMGNDVKVLAVISKKSLGEKFCQFKSNIVAPLSGIFRNLKSSLSCVQYVFNGFDSVDRRTLRATFESLLVDQQLTEEKDKDYFHVVSDIIKKTGHKRNVIFLEFLDDEAANCRENILEMIEEMSDLHGSESSFKFSVNSRALDAMELQLQLLHSQVKGCLRTANWNIVEYRLEQLQSFAKLDNKAISLYEEILESVLKEVGESYQTNEVRLVHYSSSGSKLTEEDLVSFELMHKTLKSC
jgi:energy-coupling factor transporter ATP-binding protein EcfA2